MGNSKSNKATTGLDVFAKFKQNKVQTQKQSKGSSSTTKSDLNQPTVKEDKNG
jgi:hypothetical protein